MALLDEKIQSQLRTMFAELRHPVKLVMFTQAEGGALECALCNETRMLVEELGALSEKIEVEILDFVADQAAAKGYEVDKIPAIAILGAGTPAKDAGIRFYGIPSGYEFSSLIETILMVGRDQHGLGEATVQALQELQSPAHIQVYVTPTWPYCPRAVVLANQLALASEKVRADTVEATEFPHLSNRYQVYGVPRIVINEVLHIEGAVPEPALLAQLRMLDDPEHMQALTAKWKQRLKS